MTEEQRAKKKQYAGEKKASMKRRDDGHDYTERRMYMITLEVEGRLPLFGRLVGDAFAPDGSGNEPRIELTELGKAVQSEWMGIHAYYPQIEVVAVQMMPDHMHGILFVTAPLPVHLGQVITGFKAGCRKAQRAIAEMAAGSPQPTEKGGRTYQRAETTAASPQPTEKGEGASTAMAVLRSQQAAAPPSQGSRPYQPLFAKGYNDLILRSYDELPAWQNYLKDNPRRLMMKRCTPTFLRPFFSLQKGTHTYSGIGNRELLIAAQRIPVILSRHLTEKDIEREVSNHLEQARQGAVMVSASISTPEKKVMRAVFNAGYPTVVVLENGFTSLSKPHGEQFYACARGTLLMLSPWEHHNEKRPLTREMCRQLNLMVLELCE